MTVGVLMSVYAKVRPDELSRSIQSILNQTYADFQFFIGLDGPIGDALESVLAQYAYDNRLVFIRFEKNRGLAAVLNDLIKESTQCALLARMDADDIALPNRLERQSAFLSTHPEVDVLGCAIEEVDEQQHSLGTSYYPTSSEDCFRWFAKWNPVVHSAVMFRRRFFEKAGYYDESYLRHQDTMLWVKGFRSGCVFANMQEVLMQVTTTTDLFKYRLGGFRLAWKSFKDRIKINRLMGYGLGAYVYAFQMFIAMIHPAWFRTFAIKGR